ncbi:MAG: 1-(5-phosphoribosyl)-5-[(5-phosphoribosylamino)methylideneamino]imidazole-4-carboxamide isomerase [Clostridia bacterium]|nr:1-(5-phosphoribosyl)-5-[(5-phosphoribosylamino)methylideneamino]imidazole-4-carboxamide isomerase [Clostridia bacterium]
MLIFPAIDIYQGCAVRLYKGDYSKKTVYSPDPVRVALDLVSEGARQIHIVDLEGARTGLTPNFELIKEIKKASGAFCEVGGGIRTPETAEKYIESGIDRVIFGTSAVKNADILRDAVSHFGDRIAVSIDVRNGMVAASGWEEDTGVGVLDFCRDIQGIGVHTVICTDISRDGMLQGPSFELYTDLQSRYPAIDFTVSGGISSMADIERLNEEGLRRVIIGKAIYEHRITLKDIEQFGAR